MDATTYESAAVAGNVSAYCAIRQHQSVPRSATARENTATLICDIATHGAVGHREHAATHEYAPAQSRVITTYRGVRYAKGKRTTVRNTAADVVTDDATHNANNAVVGNDSVAGIPAHRTVCQFKSPRAEDSAALKIIVHVAAHNATYNIDLPPKPIENPCATSAIVATSDS